MVSKTQLIVVVKLTGLAALMGYLFLQGSTGTAGQQSMLDEGDGEMFDESIINDSKLQPTRFNPFQQLPWHTSSTTEHRGRAPKRKLAKAASRDRTNNLRAPIKRARGEPDNGVMKRNRKDDPKSFGPLKSNDYVQDKPDVSLDKPGARDHSKVNGDPYKTKPKVDDDKDDKPLGKSDNQQSFQSDSDSSMPHGRNPISHSVYDSESMAKKSKKGKRKKKDGISKDKKEETGSDSHKGHSKSTGKGSTGKGSTGKGSESLAPKDKTGKGSGFGFGPTSRDGKGSASPKAKGSRGPEIDCVPLESFYFEQRHSDRSKKTLKHNDTKNVTGNRALRKNKKKKKDKKNGKLKKKKKTKKDKRNKGKRGMDKANGGPGTDSSKSSKKIKSPKDKGKKVITPVPVSYLAFQCTNRIKTIC